MNEKQLLKLQGRVAELLKEGATLSKKEKNADDKEIVKFGPAQNFLVEFAYEQNCDPAIQAAFNNILPRNRILRDKLRVVRRQLDASNPKARLKIAREIRKATSSQVSSDLLIWLRHPDMIDLLVSHLQSETDSDVLESLINAVGGIYGRYFSNPCVGRAILPFLESENPRIMVASLVAIGRIRMNEKWGKIVKLSKSITSEKMLDGILLNFENVPNRFRPSLMDSLFSFLQSRSCGQTLKEKTIEGICDLANVKHQPTHEKLLSICDDDRTKRKIQETARSNGREVTCEYLSQL